ncbi:GNAT family N-acetyltransferase [Cohnella silvisoli]|uniref:GNAT family N-acetyltransferase n=1 Tax=Cohnella silvisoli TaxID=2873699 RepID=A0ABV1KZQ5_9BACL|nr:GNAT family N-acetyltransferase [Cohnella silvisoli]MCD9021833.1 GNAT family N-acetyltransferase [Cohnella silvisoli]
MISIEPIKYEHLSDLCRLYEELINKETNYTKLVKVYESIQDNSDYIILGAFNEGELVGSLMGIICQDIVGECKPFMVIENVIVSARARRQGVGEKLMLEIENIAKERGCYYVLFVSGGQRTEAHAFYEKLGFKEEKVEGYRKHLY